MIVHVNPEGVTRNIIPFVDDSRIRTEIMKTQALKQALDQHEFDVAFGGARWHEENSREKKKYFPFAIRNITVTQLTETSYNKWQQESRGDSFHKVTQAVVIWRLPPTTTDNRENPVIGEPDRMTLRFRTPYLHKTGNYVRNYSVKNTELYFYPSF